MRLVTNLVKNMHVADAIDQLQFMNKKAAGPVLKLIQSAVANASNNFKMDKEKLYIKTITADSGPKLKRYFPRAQGSAHLIRRPTSHVHVLLEERAAGKKKAIRATRAKNEQKPKAELAEVKEDKNENKPNIQHSQTDKTNEQIKSNKIQQKRRLFNRKSGV